jgi:hypothetical protein|tara:strand:- start:498 stop:1013 length:516 start_codon:yes stop_codon:yes gene_type:complete
MNNFEHAERLAELTAMGAHELALMVIRLEHDVEVYRLGEELQVALRQRGGDGDRLRAERDALQQLDAALEREAALAAHLERIIAARNSRRGDTLANICAVIDDSTHQTSLTRRDLIKQAEGAEMVSEDAKMRIEKANAIYPKFDNSGYRQCIYTADSVAANLRQRAQELTP